MGIIAEPCDFADRIAGILAGAELRACNIHGIGTAAYCRNADVCISCRSKKFYWSHLTF